MSPGVSLVAGERRVEASNSTSTTSTSGVPEAALDSAVTVYIAIFLSVVGLIVLGIITCKIRQWARSSRHERPPSSENVSNVKTEAGDLEAQTAAIPVVPPLGVCWTPQIRSISCPMPVDSEKKSTNLTSRRARSPPPTYVSKPPNPFADVYPKTAPPHALSFAVEELETPVSGSHPVTPQALSVSGMQTRSLGRAGQLAKNLASMNVD